jgi:two-component system response regulator YesN
MYKVLIVEDEMLVRVGLKNSMPWSKHNMEVIADVSNGQEALAVYERDKPDLIITDLKMPVMDGLELIAAVRREDQNTKILILSCIEEFEYARRAASLNVSGYILKLTMTVGEMETVLSAVRKELASRSPSAPSTLSHPMNVNKLKEKLIKDYLFYGVYSETELAVHLKQMNSRIEPSRMMMAILETSEYSRLLKRFNDERGELIHFTILNVLNEILGNHGLGEAFHDHGNRYLLLFSCDEHSTDEDIRIKLNDMFENARKALKTYFDVSVFICASDLSQGFRPLKKLYRECSVGMEARYFSETPILFLSDRRLGNPEIKWKKAMLASCSAWGRLGETLQQDLRLEVQKRTEQPLSDERSWKRLFNGLMDWTCSYLGIPEDHSALVEMSGAKRIEASPTIRDSVEAWEIHLEETANVKSMIKSVSKEVADAVQYIRQHYDQEISLKEISDYVQLSPNYMSLLFKKDMGRNLIEYLTDYRMEKAKELLQSTTLKTYEIAENVGVPDSAYFSRIFKKTTGVSPLEFRKRRVLSGKAGSHEDS